MTMSWNPALTLSPCLAAAFVLSLALPAAAQPQEPYGMPFGGWTITQGTNNGSDVCRAFSPGPTLGAGIYKQSDGTFVVKTGGAGVRKGTWEEASFEIGSEAEPVKAWQPGNATLYFQLDDHLIGRLVKAGRAHWAIDGRKFQGDVVFNSSIGTAVSRLRQCMKANGH